MSVTLLATFFFKFIYFIYLFLAVLSLLLRAGFLQLQREGATLLCGAGFSLRWPLSLWSMGCRHAGFSSCGTRAQQLWLTGSRAQAQQLWSTGLLAPRHVGSSRTRARTRVPCTGRRTPKHCATREALFYFDKYAFKVSQSLSELTPTQTLVSCPSGSFKLLGTNVSTF